MRIHIKSTIIAIFIVLAFWVIGLLLMIAVFSLPTTRMEKHLKKSVYIFENEGTRPRVLGYKLDNFTDALELSEAVYNDEESSTVEKAVRVYRSDTASGHPVESIINHYVNGEDYTLTTSYARYWHWYLVFLKPLLLFCNFSEIRIVNCILQTILLTCIVFIMCRNGLMNVDVPYLLTVLILNPVSCAFSMQFSSCYYILLIGTIALLVMHEHNRNDYSKWVFLLVGIATAYFDLLTYPVMPFGILLILWVRNSSYDNSKTLYKSTLINSASWILGYAGMWIGKWIIGSLLLGENVVAEAVSVAMQRMGDTNIANGDTFTVSDTISKNVKELLSYDILKLSLMIFGVYVLVFLIYGFKKKQYNYRFNNSLINNIVILAIALLPFVWYCCTRNHSSIHFWMANKELLIAVYALLAILQNIVDCTCKSACKG